MNNKTNWFEIIRTFIKFILKSCSVEQVDFHYSNYFIFFPVRILYIANIYVYAYAGHILFIQNNFMYDDDYDDTALRGGIYMVCNLSMCIYYYTTGYIHSSDMGRFHVRGKMPLKHKNFIERQTQKNYLNKGSAWGVYWHIDRDTFKFYIKIKNVKI